MAIKIVPAVVVLLLSLFAEAQAAQYGVRDQAVIKRILAQHNKIRSKYHAKPLTWSKILAKSAQAWTNKCIYDHDITTLRAHGYGENLSAGVGLWKDAISQWTSEERNYNWKVANYQSNAGHFTQVVWKGTRVVGCSKTDCKFGKMWSCRYFPAGNYVGIFKQNVGK